MSHLFLVKSVAILKYVLYVWCDIYLVAILSLYQPRLLWPCGWVWPVDTLQPILSASNNQRMLGLDPHRESWKSKLSQYVCSIAIMHIYCRLKWLPHDACFSTHRFCTQESHCKHPLSEWVGWSKAGTIHSSKLVQRTYVGSIGATYFIPAH